MIMFVSSFSFASEKTEPSHENSVKTETSTTLGNTPEGFVRIHSASDDPNRENIEPVPLVVIAYILCLLFVVAIVVRQQQIITRLKTEMEQFKKLLEKNEKP